MARETGNQGYQDAQAYSSDPSANNVPDSSHQEYEIGVKSFQLANMQGLTVDSSGNLGVGTSSPYTKLHISETNGCTITISDANAGLNLKNRYIAVDEGSLAFGLFNDALNSSSEHMRLDSSGNLLVGKTAADFATQGAAISGNGTVNCTRSAAAAINVNRLTDDGDLIGFYQAGTKEGSIGISGTQLQVNGNGSLGLQTGGTTRATIDSSGNLLVGKTNSSDTDQGFVVLSTGQARAITSGTQPLTLNRLTNDGTIVSIRQGSVEEGAIVSSGTTVSYNGGHLARWSRMLDGSKPENLLKGTVMSNLDEMVEWAYPETPEVLWAAGDGLPEGVSVGDVKVEGKEATYWGELGEAVPGFAGDVQLGDVKSEAVEEVLWTETDGFPEGVQIGDVKVPYKAAGVEDNEQLNHTAVSSVEGDRDVAGVFIAWDDDDEYNDYHLAMVGDVIIRIAEGVEVQRGDLLVSAGDGTAKPLDPEAPLTVGLQAAIVAKVTSKEVSCVYDDGSFCVPCVLK